MTKFGPSDAEEWYLVLKEVAAFVEVRPNIKKYIHHTVLIGK